MSSPEPNEFERAAAAERDESFLVEFGRFLRHNKKWWLAPIVVVLLALGALIYLAGSPAAPFIYPL
jgi:hypothetical protein